MHRRRFLSTLASAIPLASCSARRAQVRAPAFTGRRFARVNVSRDRVIRTVVGLRPYRPSGFVVRTESAGGKTIVHNYGHGGGGVTLSWGTAHLAAEQALPAGASRMAVLGAGAVGLATRSGGAVLSLTVRRGRAVLVSTFPAHGGRLLRHTLAAQLSDV